MTAAADAGAQPERIPYKHPLLWVPTSYFAMGTVYVMVTTASNVMFKNLGLPNEQAAAYSSLTGFAFTFKPLWAPLLELYKTKRFWVIMVELVLAGIFGALAIALKLPAWLYPVLGMLVLAAIMGATQDIANDGVYVTTLDSKNQAKFTGFQSMSWNVGYILANGFLVLAVGVLAGEKPGQALPSTSAYSYAWTMVALVFSVTMVVLAGWHYLMLPAGSKAKDAPRSFSDAMGTFGKAFVTFFQKKDIWLLLGFAFFYRFGLGLLDKIAPLFLLDPRAEGGLGLDNTTLGWLNGIVGTSALIIGSIVGGLWVSKRGLKKSLLFLCLALNVPNVTFLYLGAAQPSQTWLIGVIFFIEKFGWGFGAVGHMIYMMQQIAPGPYKTAHYAFATGLGLSLCMTATGIVSGYLQTAVGYQTYFMLALVAAAPSILFTVLAPFHYEDDSAVPTK
ncbi:MAG TPA: MFS transporter [Polyangiaceae bacterium]|nr:MFS transporter [Polyangiaceae bacterium]